MDESRKDCRRCPLLEHRKSYPVPIDGLLAWQVFQRMTSPAVERFGLQTEVVRSLNLQLRDDQVDVLIADLDEILEGIHEAREALKPAPKGK